jgi:hypothetical protein
MVVDVRHTAGAVHVQQYNYEMQLSTVEVENCVIIQGSVSVGVPVQCLSLVNLFNSLCSKKAIFTKAPRHLHMV